MWAGLGWLALSAAPSTAKVSIFLLISLALLAEFMKQSKEKGTARATQQHTADETEQETNKTPLFLRSIKHKSKDLCDLRECVCVRAFVCVSELLA